MSTHTILLVDDFNELREMLAALLGDAGYETVEAATTEEGLEKVRLLKIDLVLLDMNIPQAGGEAALNQIRNIKPELPVIVLTGEKDSELAVRCMKAGALDYLIKPCGADRLLTTIRNALQILKLEVRLREATSNQDSEDTFDALYGRSSAMHRIFEQLRVLSQSDIGVLIEGFSGTGKELVARALHRKGPRRDGPFVAINCGAIPESLLESELFGHERGAFTGAISARAGCFEQADRGTLFLDEIGEMRPDMQVRLLRVLETREVQRLGGTKRVKFDVRVVTATNRDLRERVAIGAFREDLYYRLAIYRLGLPALKDRESDVVELAERFLLEFGVKLQKRNFAFSPAVPVLLRTYNWPGNVRQLRNAIERATLIARGNQVEIGDFPEEIAATPIDLSAIPVLGHRSAARLAAVANPNADATGQKADVEVHPEPCVANRDPLGGYASADEILTMAAEERRIFERALKITGGDVTETARRLDVSRATLYRRIKELNLHASA